MEKQQHLEDRVDCLLDLLHEKKSHIIALEDKLKRFEDASFKKLNYTVEIEEKLEESNKQVNTLKRKLETQEVKYNKKIKEAKQKQDQYIQVNDKCRKDIKELDTNNANITREFKEYKEAYNKEKDGSSLTQVRKKNQKLREELQTNVIALRDVKRINKNLELDLGDARNTIHNLVEKLDK